MRIRNLSTMAESRDNDDFRRFVADAFGVPSTSAVRDLGTYLDGRSIINTLLPTNHSRTPPRWNSRTG